MPATQVKETAEDKAAKRKLSMGMPITVKNDSKKEIEIHKNGELNVVKVGGSLSGVKSDFFPADLYKVGKIKGVDITSSAKGGAPKEKVPKEKALEE